MASPDAPTRVVENPNENPQHSPAGERGLSFLELLSSTEASAANPFGSNDYSYRPGDAGFVSGVRDWTNVDLRQQYGFRKTADGFTADNISGPDGTIYGVDIDRSGTRQPPEQVWRLDRHGNRVPVTDPAIIRQVADAGNKMFDVWAAKNVLEELGLSDQESRYVNAFMDAMRAGDAGAIQRLIDQYSGSRDRFGDLFIAMFSQKALQNMENYHIGLLHLGDRSRLLVTFPGQTEMSFDIR